MIPHLCLFLYCPNCILHYLVIALWRYIRPRLPEVLHYFLSNSSFSHGPGVIRLFPWCSGERVEYPDERLQGGAGGRSWRGGTDRFSVFPQVYLVLIGEILRHWWWGSPVGDRLCVIASTRDPIRWLIVQDHMFTMGGAKIVFTLGVE